MAGDYTRFRYSPPKDAAGILMQQGRVLLDQDWNEFVQLQDRRWRAETVDIVGRAVVPTATPQGFQIQIAGSNLTIDRGHLYVDGLVVEDHGTGPVEYDPVLGEVRGTQPIPYDAQPYFPNPPALPGDNGPHLVYLDVWEREVTYLEDPDLIDKAVGVDTATRMQTVWQVKVLPDVGAIDCCSTPDDQIPGWSDIIAPSAGQLTTAAAGVPSSNDPCIIPANGGYRGTDNRLYRVEIHTPGALGTAQFKWSRDNASVATPVTSINSAGDTLTVSLTKRDSVLRFQPNDWVEITDDVHEFAGLSGEMHQVAAVDDIKLTVQLKTALTPGVFDATKTERHTRLIRWDQSGIVRDPVGNVIVDVDANGGLIPLPVNDTVVLEDGVQVTFSIDSSLPGGRFKVGDYWVFATRVVDASVEQLQQSPPRGILHHYCRLAVISKVNGILTLLQDCRKLFAPSTAGIQVCKVLAKDGYDHDIPLCNGMELQADNLSKGLRLILNQDLNPVTVNEAACFVTLQLPYPLIPLNTVDQSIWGSSIIGYQPLVLPADVETNPQNTVTWQPFDDLSLFFQGEDRLEAMRRRRVATQFQKDWQIFDPPASPPPPAQTILPSQWGYQEDNVVQSTLAGHTLGGAGFAGLNTNSINIQRLKENAYYIGLTVNPNFTQPSGAFIYQNVGLIFNWLSDDDYYFFRFSWTSTAIEGAPLQEYMSSVEIYHKTKNDIIFITELTDSRGSGQIQELPNNQVIPTVVSLNIKLTRNGLLFRAIAVYSNPIAAFDQTFFVVDPQQDPTFPQTFLLGSGVGLCTRFVTAKFTRLEVIYPDARNVLVPAGGSRILANLTLKRNFIQPLTANQSSGNSAYPTCTLLPAADFEQWFWVVPPIPRYDYYGYSFPDFLGFGSELL